MDRVTKEMFEAILNKLDILKSYIHSLNPNPGTKYTVIKEE